MPVPCRVFFALLIGALLLSFPGPSHAGLGGTGAVNRQPLYSSSFAFGPSFGWNLEKDSWYWGAMTEYGYSLDDRWTLSAGLTYEQEIEKVQDQSDETTNTISALGMVNYRLTRSLSLATGLAKGFLDDDHAGQGLKFRSGDWTTGLALGIDIPWTNERSWFISCAYEYNISQSEGSIGFDGGVSLAF